MLGIEVSRQSELSLARQIYQSIRDGIFAGRLRPGEALPSTRELAAQLAVGRNTVNEAYDMLLAEGYILTHQGAPTRVAEDLLFDMPAASEHASPITPAFPSYRADFRTGQPDLRCFPRYLWNRLLRKAAEELPLDQFGYSGPDGLPQLRQQIAAWLLRSRGLVVDPQTIFITAGATQALHLLADLLYVDGKEILVEDPCHAGMLRALQGKGKALRPLAVDSRGLLTDALHENNACAVYVTPSHQFPLGGILPANRRAALVRFAREQALYIIEDDYDSEFRYGGAPVAPLVALDSQRVIYVGTFSKALFPALRIGYAILPESLHARWRDLRMHTDVQNPPFEQAALAELLRSRKLDRHVQRMRTLYGQRRKVLLHALEENFDTGWTAWGDAAGLHVAVQFPGKVFDHNFVTLCQRNSLRAIPVEHYSIHKGLHCDKLMLGYGHLEPDQIRSGVHLLRKVMQEIG